MRYSFGDCVADFDTHEVVVRGKPVHVEPRALRLLELLIAARPRALSKDELNEAIWPGTFVTERSLARLAADLRLALDDRGVAPKYMRTVHRYGYAFCAEAGPAPRRTGPVSAFRLYWNSREIPLQEGENIVGRERDAAAWIDLDTVSRHHARITVAGDQALLEDLESKNGTFLKGRPVTAPLLLSDGDRIRFGIAELTFRRHERDVSTAELQCADDLLGRNG